jgi:crotonobetaine/carnitine-CoA ligase
VAYLTVPEAVLRAAERFGSAPALVTPAGAQTFEAMAAAVARAAGVLHRRGVRAGDRVLLLAANSPAAVCAWLGAIHAGALPAAVNPELTPPELRSLLQDLRPAAVLADAGLVEGARALAGEPGVPALALDELGAGGGMPGPHRADPLAPAAIVYTSGTTSRPKGVLVRHAAYTETGRSFPGWIGLGAEERLWACLPIFHVNAQAYSLMSCLLHGHGLAITPGFHASTFWRDAALLGVTTVNVVGAMLAFLERQPPESWTPSGLRAIYAAPAPPPPKRRELEDRFRVRITGGYGMSENTFGCAPSPTSRDKPGCIGRPRQPASGAFVNELRIVGQDGRPVAEGEPGELCFRNPVMTPGYWNAEDVTARALAGGWLHTGDVGLRDADGDVMLVGRLKEMIRRRGENIAPGEVEDALLAHPAVAAAAVFGVPSDLTEEEVVAAVVLARGAAAGQDELRAFAGERLAAYKVPREVVFREALPMTPTMRVARDVLRRDYLARQPGPAAAPHRQRSSDHER